MLPLRLSDVGWRQEWIRTANKKEQENGGNTQYLERRVLFSKNTSYKVSKFMEMNHVWKGTTLEK